MDKRQKILHKLRSIKIGWLNEQMYHDLLKRDKMLSRFMQAIKVVIFVINVIATAAGENVNYRWWTITTSIIVTFEIYINKIKNDSEYGSKIELHRSMTDECLRFNDLLDSNANEVVIENTYNTIIDKSTKLHINPEIFNLWDEEFKKRGIKEYNAFEMADGLNKELLDEKTISIPPIPKETDIIPYSPRTCNPIATTVTIPSKNKKADFELQRLFTNLNTNDI
jgi:hypothetical protein